MKQFNKNQTQFRGISTDFSNDFSFQNSLNFGPKLLKLKYLLENSKIKTIANSHENVNFFDNQRLTSSIKNSSYSQQKKIGFEMSKDFSLYLSLIEKPINLLFSIDQFLFEFSKKTYQQKKTGEFFQQLKERKKLSLFYGHLTRKQIVNIFHKVQKNKGYFAKNVFSFLETRLDVVLYRSGFTQTITEARQLIKHKKILVNQQIINVPSYSLNPGDFISMKPKTVDALTNQLENSLKTSNQRNWNFVPRNEFYSKLIQNLNSSQQKQKIKPFFKKSKKSLNSSVSNLRNLRVKQGFVNFQSKLFCELMIQLLCTKIKNRSFWTLKKKEFYFNQINFQLYSKNLKKYFLTMFKWKSFFQKKKFFSKKSIEKFGPNFEKNSLLLTKKLFRRKKNSQENFYANQGCLQKKPVFWSLRFQKNQNFFFKNSKKFQSQQSFQSKRQLNILNKKNLRFYRTSFLVFLKHLEKYKKFTGLLSLSMKKFLFKNSKNKGRVAKILNLKRIRPLHIEVSYNLLNVVYLFSPQRINFPFYIDLDLINRSVR